MDRVVHDRVAGTAVAGIFNADNVPTDVLPDVVPESMAALRVVGREAANSTAQYLDFLMIVVVDGLD